MIVRWRHGEECRSHAGMVESTGPGNFRCCTLTRHVVREVRPIPEPGAAYPADRYMDQAVRSALRALRRRW